MRVCDESAREKKRPGTALVFLHVWQVHGTYANATIARSGRKLRFVRARGSMKHDARHRPMDNQSRFFSEISASLESLCTSLAALGAASKGQGMWRDRYNNISFLRLIFLLRASVTRLSVIDEIEIERESSFSVLRSERAKLLRPRVPVRVYRMFNFRDCCTLKEETP